MKAKETAYKLAGKIMDMKPDTPLKAEMIRERSLSIIEFAKSYASTSNHISEEEIKSYAKGMWPDDYRRELAVIDGATWAINRLSPTRKESEWISEKPEFTEDCWVITGGKAGCEIWEIKKVESDEGWYMAWLDSYGDEYGDLNDMESELYLILPSTPDKKEKKEEK